MSAPILLDMTRSSWRRLKGATPSGLDRVCDAYASHFGAKSLAVLQIRGRPIVLDQSASHRLFAALELSTRGFRRELAAILSRRPFARGISGALYLNVGHSDFDLGAHRGWLCRNALRPVYMVHDLIPITHSHVTTHYRTKRHRGRVEHALRRATGIIVNSQVTAKELQLYAEASNMRAPPVLVAPLGAEPMAAPICNPQSGTPMFLSVGTIEMRKNHLVLLKAWSQIIERMGKSAPRLVLAGSMGLRGKIVRDRLAGDPHLSRFVEIRSGLSDAQLAELYKQARALLLPTLAEGYGFPLLEALQLGVPAIASDLPSLREIGQGIPTFLDPSDSGAWANFVSDFCSDSLERARQVSLIGTFRAPRWDAHFDRCDSWLDGLQVQSRPYKPCKDSDNRIYRPAIRPSEQGQKAQC